MDETSPEASGLEVRVFLRAGHLDAPHFFPGVVELHVNRVDARVVWRHSVAHVGGDSVFLQESRREQEGGKGYRSRTVFSLTTALAETAATPAATHLQL